MITGAQIRAARSALRWTTVQLAQAAQITSRTVIRVEASDGIPSGTTNTLRKIQDALEGAGIEFVGAPHDNPGIRIRTNRK